MQHAILLLCALLVGIPLSTCQKTQPQRAPMSAETGTGPERQRAETEYRLVQTELVLAESEELYLVIDLQKKELRLKLKAAVVWNCPLSVVPADSEELGEFVRLFAGNDAILVRRLCAKHMFASQPRTSDSVLAVVGEVVKADPELLQRDVPARFQLLWGPGLILEVGTGIKGKPRSRIKNALVQLRHAIRRPFGEGHVVVKMSPDAALTLYRAAQPGLPTLMYSPPI